MSKFNVGDKVVFKNFNDKWDGAVGVVTGHRADGETFVDIVKPHPANSLYREGASTGSWPDKYLELYVPEQNDEDYEGDEFDLSIEDISGEEYNFTVTLVEDIDGPEGEEITTTYIGDFAFVTFEYDDGEFTIRADQLKSWSVTKA